MKKGKIDSEKGRKRKERLKEIRRAVERIHSEVRMLLERLEEWEEEEEG